jgi:hypothetical protein
MNTKPLVTIDKFTGMSGQGGIFWLDGFSPRKENGVSMLSDSYTATQVLDTATTGFSNINSINSIAYTSTLSVLGCQIL